MKKNIDQKTKTLAGATRNNIYAYILESLALIYQA